MKKKYIPPKKILVIMGILFIGVLIGFIFFVKMLFGIHYYRITSGLYYDKYMGKRFKIVHKEDDKIRAKKKGYKLLFYVSDERENSGYVFVPYAFFPLYVSDVSEVSHCVALFTEPKTYEIIDFFHTSTLGASSNVAICIIHNAPELEDIVFEMRMGRDLSPCRPGIDDIDVTDQTESQWTEERYQKVLKSKRNKVRGILKYIKPGDRRKKVSGVILNP